MNLDISVTKKQKEFILATTDEVLYGGAAGGGKSHGQLIDALLYAFKYASSRQLVLRRTFPELNRSLITKSQLIYPKKLCDYNQSQHIWKFANGSVIEFGYLASETDVTQYQSAEYDVIRFDELTHFTEFQYTYMLSRVRGANSFPKAIKSTANPGGVGHAWVKARFIDPRPAGQPGQGDVGQTLLYIPARLTDNPFLMRDDPNYMRRLQALPEKQRKALLDGDWNIFDGQFFPEWDEDIHVIKPFPIPAWWRRYVALDYGFDMLAALWIAVDDQGRGYVYREYCAGKDAEFFNKAGVEIAQNRLLIAGAAAEEILKRCAEKITTFYGPPDLWNRHKDSGDSTRDLFAKKGLYLTKAENSRVHGWMALREWIASATNEQGERDTRIKVFNNCRVLIASMPQLQFSDRDPNDAAIDPHPVTHAPDALRYFVAGRPLPAMLPAEADPFTRETEPEEDLAYFGM